MGQLIGIAVRSAPKAPMAVLTEAVVSEAAGVADDVRGLPGARQVTVLSHESWIAVCRDLGGEVPWTARRANLLVEGIDLLEATGAQLRVGGALLEVTGETKPCGRMDQEAAGLRDTLVPEWRGGVTCRVVSGGLVRVGDDAEMERGEVTE